jgi:hypothetical protein
VYYFIITIICYYYSYLVLFPNFIILLYSLSIIIISYRCFSSERSCSSSKDCTYSDDDKTCRAKDYCYERGLIGQCNGVCTQEEREVDGDEKYVYECVCVYLHISVYVCAFKYVCTNKCMYYINDIF